MTNVKPEHAIVKQLMADLQAAHVKLRAMRSDLDQSRADARVLAEECAEWRDAAGIKCLGGWHMQYQNEHGAECYRRIVRADATDASGALERSRQ